MALLDELGWAGVMEADFTTKRPARPVKSINNISYIRHKIDIDSKTSGDYTRRTTQFRSFPHNLIDIPATPATFSHA